jgi:hypothetical protein
MEKTIEERIDALEEVAHTHGYLQDDKTRLQVDEADIQKAKKKGILFGDPIFIVGE